MTTREQWLNAVRVYAADAGLRYTGTGPIVRMIPSFPARATRKVRLGSFVTDADGRHIGLVSPLLADNLEVATVAYWLQVRRQFSAYEDRDLTVRHVQRGLEHAGFIEPFTSCVPSEELLDRLSRVVQSVVAQYGDYPAAEVNLPTRPTQGTRLLKVACSNNHDEYVVRMSRTQYERGRPQCGVCMCRMNIALVL